MSGIEIMSLVCHEDYRLSLQSSMLRSLDSTQDRQPSLHSGVNWGPKEVSFSYVVSVTGSSDRSFFPRTEHLHLFIQFCGEQELSSIES